MTGFSLIELLVALLLFTAVMLAGLMLFQKCVSDGRAKNAERQIYSEAINALAFIEKHLAPAIVNDLSGGNRINFIGAAEQVRFVAPAAEGDGSDLAKFGIYREGDRILAAVMRVTRDRPGMGFSEGFSGAQVLCENVKGLKFSYGDGTVWKDSWDTGTGPDRGLPACVQVDLTVAAPEKNEGRRESKTFTVLVKLN